ncbi:MAG: glycosyltransferase family 39 protein [Armatimonadota bacterium]|nr:glycosyltransferase family 39 protein [bacterium]
MLSLYSMLISIMVLTAGAGVGTICRRLWRTDASRADGLLIDTALGLGVLSLVIFAAAAAQLIVIVVPLVAIFALIYIIGLIRGHKSGGKQTTRSRRRVGFASILLVILATAALIPALAPPSMSDWDSLAYHLAVPKLWIERGGIYRIDFTSHSNFPMLVEMLYIPGLALNDPVAAKLINYWMGVMLVACVMMLVKRHFDPEAAPLSAVAFAGMPLVLWLATTAYIDLATALYTVLAVYLLLCYFDKAERPYLIGSAMAAGFAASTKMTGLVVVGLILTWLVIDRLFSKNRVFQWKRGLMFAGIALAVCSPWYIKSIIYTGNPVYPFFYSIFGGRNWTADLARQYATQQSLFGMGHNLKAFLMLPYNLTMHSERFYDIPGLYVGPILFIAVPILIFSKYRSRKLVGLALFFLAMLVSWFMLTHQSRYLVSGFAILAALVAVLGYQLRMVRYALWVVFVGTALFGVLTLIPAIISTVPVVFGQESRDDYLARALDVYQSDQWINNNLQKNTRIALFGDTRGFYIDRDYVWADPGHNTEFTRTFDSPEKFVSYLKSRRVTHVLVNFRFYPKRGKGTQAVYGAIDEGLLEEVYPANATLYEVR